MLLRADLRFAYLKVVSWGWLHLSTILDDCSRYIVSWQIRTDMKVADVTNTVGMALDEAGKCAVPCHRLRLLSDNGGAYIAEDLLADWLEERGVKQVHGAPGYPQIQGSRRDRGARR